MNGLTASSPRRPGPSVFDRLPVLADPIRCRLLLVLESRELTVSEICKVLQLPQSTVSRHLKMLSGDGWVTARRDGTSRLYAAAPAPPDAPATGIWALLREEVAAGAAAEQDRRRLERILATRRTRSQEFFSSAAGRWSQMRREMFGGRFDLLALPGLLDESWTVGDLGCGTGQIAAALAPFVRRVVAVDDSAAMLEAAKDRLRGLDNVELRGGRLERLPVEDAELDAATVVLVLHHLSEPARALAEVGRALRPGGRLLLVDMGTHDREEYRQQMGHLWLGFAPETIERWLEAAGFEAIRLRELPPEPEAQGPSLFAATARRLDRGRAASQPKTTRPPRAKGPRRGR